MKKVFHILNGDALKDQFPETIAGEQIIMRECLVDGPIIYTPDANSLSKFYQIRASFLNENYEVGSSIYHNTSMSEIERIREIPEQSEVYLWFEDDLFCQINLWFVCFLLTQKDALKISLVRPALVYSNKKLPKTYMQHGFGGLDSPLLESAFHNALLLSHQATLLFAKLWKAYATNNKIELLEISAQLEIEHEFITAAASACLGLWEGHPTQLLKEIKRDLATSDFGKIFKRFKQLGAIYGFGDVQVKRILDA